MAKQKEKKVGGPFIAAAMLCNSVSEDSDGVLSAMRIVDQVGLNIPPDAPPDFPSKAKPIDVSLFALIIIRRGDAKVGKHNLRLVMENPEGKIKPLAKAKIEFPQFQNGAANVKIRLGLKLYTPGVFWIDVILDKQRLTRMALNLILNRPERSGSKT